MSKTEVYPWIGAVIGWVLGLLAAVMLKGVVLGAGMTTVLNCGICGLILGVVVGSWMGEYGEYENSLFYIIEFVGAMCGVLFGIILYAFDIDLMVGAGMTTVLNCGICGLILGVVVGSWTSRTHEGRTYGDLIFVSAFVGAMCGVFFSFIFFIAGVTFTIAPVFTVFIVSLFTVIGYFRVPFLFLMNLIEVKRNWIGEKRRRVEWERHERERIRRAEERRRFEYEQKMRKYKTQLEQWEREGYDVSALKEKWFK